MFATDDTIVAIATPAGRGAIGIVRLSGPRSVTIASSLLEGPDRLEPRRATHATLSTGPIRDTVVVTWFKAPSSYTGDDVVEISAHGSAAVLHGIVAAAVSGGARLAAPGEFTLRAFINGKIDLIQAEAVADLIEAATPLQAQVAFEQLDGTLSTELREIEETIFDLIAKLEASIDFPEEGYHFIDPRTAACTVRQVVSRIDSLLAQGQRGTVIREGARVVIAGLPNAGKSQLFNALVGTRRAIVSEVAGTTRDLITETVDFDGVRVTLVDTAGLVETNDVVEREGVARARAAVTTADLVLRVVDSSVPRSGGPLGFPVERELVVASKADLPAAWNDADALCVSAIDGTGIEALIARAKTLLVGDQRAKDDRPRISNLRHINLLSSTRTALLECAAAIDAEGGQLSEEFVVADLQQVMALLQEVAGRRTTEATLHHIFERFCIGK
ncbi:MAG: tRNA uridine-5-carboxymethylaminomethyl(34) synthesis GTPase MnmE [Acidobacteria bacterium]|nr:tRNA uridine-5-carboxymethylaminomethyl(34) synthesis GTPase MnmE [Acidobacteriota bacterium]